MCIGYYYYSVTRTTVTSHSCALHVMATQKVGTRSLRFTGGNKAQSLSPCRRQQQIQVWGSWGSEAFSCFRAVLPLLAWRPLWVSDIYLSQKWAHTWDAPMGSHLCQARWGPWLRVTWRLCPSMRLVQVIAQLPLYPSCPRKNQRSGQHRRAWLIQVHFPLEPEALGCRIGCGSGENVGKNE